jgi:hypothetical protein
MPSYRVCFINEIPRGGRLFRCCQRSIVIRSARSPERAVEAAKKRFVRLEGIRDWQIHAHRIEMEELDLAAEAGAPAAQQVLMDRGDRSVPRPHEKRRERKAS